MAVVREDRVEHLHQSVRHRLLEESVLGGWDAQFAFSAIGFLDGLRADRAGLVGPGAHLRLDGLPVLLQVGGEVFDPNSVDSGCPVVGDHLLQGRPEVRRFEDIVQSSPVQRVHGFVTVGPRFVWSGPLPGSTGRDAGAVVGPPPFDFARSHVPGLRLSRVLRSFALPGFRRASSLLRPLLTPSPLSRRRASPGKVQKHSGRAAGLHLWRLSETCRISHSLACSSPATCLSVRSCSYGRPFATRLPSAGRFPFQPCASLRFFVSRSGNFVSCYLFLPMPGALANTLRVMIGWMRCHAEPRRDCNTEALRLQTKRRQTSNHDIVAQHTP